MKTIVLKTGDRAFTLNDNGDKYQRAIVDAGPMAEAVEILAHYDKLGGLILNEQGIKIPNGAFWDNFKKWKREEPEFIRILENREKTLDEGESKTIELASLNIDHKRALLGTLMTISAAIIAGLFFLFSGNDQLLSECSRWFLKASGIGHALFLVSAPAWLAWILSSESQNLDSHLEFVKKSQKEFVESIGSKINDIESYNKYREEKHKQEDSLRKDIKASSEIWFRLICGLFIASSLPLLVIFIST